MIKKYKFLYLYIVVHIRQHIHVYLYIIDSECSCVQEGNRYTPRREDNCDTFIQTQISNGRSTIQPCAHGLKFDVNTCVCNDPGLVDCESCSLPGK